MGSEIILHQNISRELHEPFSTGEFDASISKILDETRNVSKAAQSRSPVHTKEIEVEAIHFLKEKNKAGCLYGKVLANLQGINDDQLNETVPSRINHGGPANLFCKVKQRCHNQPVFTMRLACSFFLAAFILFIGKW